MKTSRLSALLALIAGLAWLAYAAPQSHAQQSAPASSERRVYIASEENVRRALEKMLAIFGRKLSGEGLPDALVNGKFEFRSVDEVMAYFKSSYQINWFQNGTTVYIYRSSDWRTTKVYVGGDRSNDDWKEYITAAGLYYKDFPFVFQPDTRELVISGPSSYLKLVQSSFSVPRPDPSELEKHGVSLMSFPLKYASVEDRQTTLRNSLITTPGALTVLLNLLGMPRQMASLPGDQKKVGANVERRMLAGQQQEGDADRMNRTSPNRTTGAAPKPAGSEGRDTDGLPTITADSRTNTILIRDAKSKYEFYKELIDKLDQPMAMIEVEAMMVEVNESALKELGLEFGLLTRNLIYEMPSPAVSNRRILNSNSSVGAYPGDFIPGSSSVVDPLRFMARLRALASDENAKVLARPTILTQDNVPAYIDLSQTLYVSLTGERAVDLVPVTAGSLLQVTPRLVREEGDQRIFLRIDIQDGTLTEATMGALDRSPKIQNTSLSTQALIQRDKAILVGGYNREVSSNKEFKVPVLGDLPFVGAAFRSSERQTSTVARLFLITPRLLDQPIENAASTRAAVTRLNKSFGLSGNELEKTPLPSLRMEPTLRN